jgi:hypothetical protein
MVRGAVGGRCDHAAGDRDADPMATEDGVEKLPIDWRGQSRGKECEQKGLPSGSPCITIPSATSASTLAVKPIA